jgi:hypothetical protein
MEKGASLFSIGMFVSMRSTALEKVCMPSSIFESDLVCS